MNFCRNSSSITSFGVINCSNHDERFRLKSISIIALVRDLQKVPCLWTDTSYVPRQQNAPGPEPVVEAMLDAITGDDPKIRYVVSADAEAMVAAKSSMSDEEFDAMILGHLDIKRV
jgi:hypothetical protein